MIGPMAVVTKDKELGIPRSLADVHPIDPNIQDLLSNGIRKGKKRPDRHRFAEKPVNPRALHN